MIRTHVPHLNCKHLGPGCCLSDSSHLSPENQMVRQRPPVSWKCDLWSDLAFDFGPGFVSSCQKIGLFCVLSPSLLLLKITPRYLDHRLKALSDGWAVMVNAGVSGAVTGAGQQLP